MSQSRIPEIQEDYPFWKTKNKPTIYTQGYREGYDDGKQNGISLGYEKAARDVSSELGQLKVVIAQNTVLIARLEEVRNGFSTGVADEDIQPRPFNPDAAGPPEPEENPAGPPLIL